MPLTPEQWDTVKDIVFDALQLPATERLPFVHARCARDPELLAESLSLIAQSSAVGNSGATLIKERYRLLWELARGGFAITYLAADQDLHDRRVVVKMLITAKASPYVYRKFEDEIRALSLLEHPNIITPLDCGKTDDGQPFLVIQYAEGATLRAWMRTSAADRRALPSLVRQLGSALAFAHKRGIVHRDVKPENVMTQTFPDGSVHVRLIDFGISSILEAADSSATSIAGTPSYMAPEQFRGEVSPKTDVFAFGALVYEFLAGKPPFGGGDPLQVMERQRSKSVPEIDPPVCPKATSLISRALAFKPADRPADLASFAEELAVALLSPVQMKQASRPLWAGVAVALVLVALSLAYTFLRTPQRPVPHLAPAPPAMVSPPILARIDIETQRGLHPVPDRHGMVNLTQREQFRLRVRAVAENHLYIFSRSVENADTNILFPSPTSNGGQSELKESSILLIPAEPEWLTFGNSRGTDTLIFITAREADPVLEKAKEYANIKDKGAVPEGPITQHVAELTASGNALSGKGGSLELVGFQSACSWVTVQHR